MAEYSKERLYFVKLPSDFFQSHRMRILESMPNGREYALTYLKLVLESVSHNGYLRFSETQPYTEEMIAALTGNSVQETKACLMILERLELLEVNGNGSVFLPDVPKMTGHTTDGAARKAEQRLKRTAGGQEADICPPEYRDKRLEYRLESNLMYKEQPNNDRQRIKGGMGGNPDLERLAEIARTKWIPDDDD